MWTVELWPWHLLRADMEEENQPSGFGYGKFGEFIEYSNKRDAQATGYTSMKLRLQSKDLNLRAIGKF